MNGYVYGAECLNCQPWVRRFRSHATGIHVRQVLHEDSCPTYPRFTRDDINAFTGD